MTRPPVAGARTNAASQPLVDYVLRIADDRLVLGHRVSEWCGHGPILEEDIALSNIALDLIGAAAAWLALAGTLEGTGRDADALAFFRDETAYRNALLVEQPNGDFAATIVRQFLFDAYSVLQLDALSRCGHPEIAAIAAKSLKEDKYHLRHSSDWMLKLGDGTPESHARAQRALDALWRYTDELFVSDAVDLDTRALGVAIDLDAMRAQWDHIVSDVLARATLSRPTSPARASGGRTGRHTEHLGHMLADMQIVARSHPGATWEPKG